MKPVLISFVMKTVNRQDLASKSVQNGGSVVVILNPILDGVRDTPIMDGGGGAKAPRFNSATWGLTTMKLGRNVV